MVIAQSDRVTGPYRLRCPFCDGAESRLVTTRTGAQYWKCVSCRAEFVR